MSGASPVAKKAKMTMENNAFVNKSWVDVDEMSHFPLENLPFGVFSSKDGQHAQSIGVAIGQQVVSLRVLSEASLLSGKALGDGSCFQQV